MSAPRLGTRGQARALSYGLVAVLMTWALTFGFAAARADSSKSSDVQGRPVTIKTQQDADQRRQQLAQFIWGPAGSPPFVWPEVRQGIASPVTGLHGLARVDELRIPMDAGEVGLAHHFIAAHPNNRLVVLHNGHTCSFDDGTGYDFGFKRTIDALLSSGFSVLGVYMPRYHPDDCRGGHDEMFSIPTAGSPMKFFLEPIVASLRYLKLRALADGFPFYLDYDMIGLSGGGWTTTVYSALDQSIRLSIPVAGSLPLWMQPPQYRGDAEQTLSNFYQIASYQDLYVLGSEGLGRRQLQILNRHDPCCFGEPTYDPAFSGLPFDAAVSTYEAQVEAALASMIGGQFHVHIDDTALNHMISPTALGDIVMPLLQQDPITMSVADTQDHSLSSVDATTRGLGAGTASVAPASGPETMPTEGVAPGFAPPQASIDPLNGAPNGVTNAPANAPPGGGGAASAPDRAQLLGLVPPSPLVALSPSESPTGAAPSLQGSEVTARLSGSATAVRQLPDESVAPTMPSPQLAGESGAPTLPSAPSAPPTGASLLEAPTTYLPTLGPPAPPDQESAPLTPAGAQIVARSAPTSPLTADPIRQIPLTNELSTYETGALAVAPWGEPSVPTRPRATLSSSVGQLPNELRVLPGIGQLPVLANDSTTRAQVDSKPSDLARAPALTGPNTDLLIYWALRLFAAGTLLLAISSAGSSFRPHATACRRVRRSPL